MSPWYPSKPVGEKFRAMLMASTMPAAVTRPEEESSCLGLMRGTNCSTSGMIATMRKMSAKMNGPSEPALDHEMDSEYHSDLIVK